MMDAPLGSKSSNPSMVIAASTDRLYFEGFMVISVIVYRSPMFAIGTFDVYGGEVAKIPQFNFALN